MDSTVGAAQTPRAALAALALQTMRHFIYISSADHAVIIATPVRLSQTYEQVDERLGHGVDRPASHLPAEV